MKQLMKSRRMSQTTKSVRSDVNRKAISDNNLKNMCYCLYYNLMVFDKTATIVLSANPRTSGKNEISQLNFPCECIVANNKKIYTLGERFELEEMNGVENVEHSNDAFVTVKMNEGIPVQDKSENGEKLREQMRRKYQHHILFNIINSYIKQYDQSGTFVISQKKKSTQGKLAAILLK